MFSLNPNSGIPIYKQLVDQVRRMIAGNQLKAGDELPSVRELAVQHAVNPMTISKAYSLLEAEGLLDRQRGKPMTVAQSTAGTESKAARLKRLAPAIDHLVASAHQLQLSDEDTLCAVRRAMEKNND
ncbi:MAG: GntR family transcriptional regulator [Gammaproteobacteria bacterium]|nr:GntR family transcriptional regulator [Gammaproteobacteria bacterium]